MHHSSFKCFLIDEHKTILQLCLPSSHPAYIDIINTFCGENPVSWLGKNSHDKIINCSPDFKNKILGIYEKYHSADPDLKHLREYIENIEDDVCIAFLRESILTKHDNKDINDAWNNLLRINYKRLHNKSVPIDNQALPSTSFKFACFSSENRSFLFDLGSNYPEESKNLLINFLHIVTDLDFNPHNFSDYFQKIENIRALISREEVINSKVYAFIRSLLTKLSVLKDDSFVVFSIVNKGDINNLSEIKLACLALSGGKNIDEYANSFFATERYFEINGYRRRRFTDLGFEYYIQGKQNVCRFCGKGVKDGATFRKKPHAISYFLGNEFLYGGGECDECNNFFGKQIEPHLHRYYLPTMTLCGMTGRGKSPIVDGADFELNLKNTKLLGDGCHNYSPGENIPINLTDRHPVIKANIYRCICKFIISLLNDEEIPLFADTIDWIRRKRTGGRLPMVLRNEKIDFCELPVVEVFSPLPGFEKKHIWIVIFRFISNLWVFAIPYVRGYKNNKIDDILRDFQSSFLANIDFISEDFDIETETVTCTHITHHINENTKFRSVLDMNEEERKEFFASMPKRWR